MTADKKAKMLKQQPKSPIPDPRAEVTMERSTELTESRALAGASRTKRLQLR
jgi:hypothetical protein